MMGEAQTPYSRSSSSSFGSFSEVGVDLESCGIGEALPRALGLAERRGGVRAERRGGRCRRSPVSSHSGKVSRIVLSDVASLLVQTCSRLSDERDTDANVRSLDDASSARTGALQPDVSWTYAARLSQRDTRDTRPASAAIGIGPCSASKSMPFCHSALVLSQL